MQIAGSSYRLAEKLPSEHELMQHYETGRATVRKTLAGLAQMGLVIAAEAKDISLVGQALRRFTTSSGSFRMCRSVRT